MFSLLKSFLWTSSILGVDIGTASIKIAEIVQASPKPRLKNYGILKTYSHLDRFNSAIQTNSLKIAEQDTADLLKKIVKKANFSSREAIASIPIFSAFITLLELPIISDEEIQKTMPFQIRQHIPLPITDVTIDWMKVGEREEGGQRKQQILFISVPKEIIQKYQNIFRLAGLRLKALEIESLALARALMRNNIKPTIIADIGGYSTNITVVDNGYLKAGIFTDFAGASLTQAIANGLGISPKRAEELKKRKGLKATGGEYELSTLPQPYLDVIIKEILKVKNNYENNYNIKIEQVIFSGGGANLLGLKEYFEEQSRMTVVIGNSFANLSYLSDLQVYVNELGPELAVAIGLGMKINRPFA